jgi:hypothetical protein
MPAPEDSPMADAAPVEEEVQASPAEEEAAATEAPQEASGIPPPEEDTVEAYEGNLVEANGTSESVLDAPAAEVGAGEIVNNGERENGLAVGGDGLQAGDKLEPAVNGSDPSGRPALAPGTPGEDDQEVIEEPAPETEKEAGSNATESAATKPVSSLAAAIEAAKAGTGAKPEGAEQAKTAPVKGPQLPPPEYETFEIPEHWYQKPCVRVTGLAGQVTEEVRMRFLCLDIGQLLLVFQGGLISLQKTITGLLV